MQHSQLTPAQQQLFQDKTSNGIWSEAKGSGMFALQATLIGVLHSKIRLEPQLFGGPNPKKSKDELRSIFAGQFQSWMTRDSRISFQEKNSAIICVVQKNYARHYIHLSEAATWILNATHWFSVLQQPMMIVIWCRDWQDASKLQMQILQVNYC